MDDISRRVIEGTLQDLHDITMKAERVSEHLHRALLVMDMAAASSVADVGHLFTEHLRCCWDDEVEMIARSRIREIQSAPMVAEAPF